MLVKQAATKKRGHLLARFLHDCISATTKLPYHFFNHFSVTTFQVLDRSYQFVYPPQGCLLPVFKFLKPTAIPNSLVSTLVPSSTFKVDEQLLQIQKRYKLITSGSYVLDLGCAPGAWFQV